MLLLRENANEFIILIIFLKLSKVNSVRLQNRYQSMSE